VANNAKVAGKLKKIENEKTVKNEYEVSITKFSLVFQALIQRSEKNSAFFIGISPFLFFHKLILLLIKYQCRRLVSSVAETTRFGPWRRDL